MDFRIRRLESPKFTMARKELFTIPVVIPHIIKIGNFQGLIWLRIVQRLALNVLLKMTFINKFTQGIFPMGRKIQCEHLVAIATLSAETEAEVKSTFSDKVPLHK